MITVLLLFTVFFLLLFQLIKKSLWSQLAIPEVRGLPIIGNLLPVVLKKKTYFEIIENIYKLGEGKDYIGFYNGTQPTLLIRNPDLVEIMFKEEAKNFEDRGLCSDLTDPLSLNLFYLKGKQWKWTRSKLRPAFSNFRLKTVFDGIESCTVECQNSFGSSVDIKEAMDQHTCNVIAKTVFCVQDNTGFVENSHKAFSLSGLSGIAVLLRIFIPHFALSVGIKTVPQESEAFYRNAISRSTRVPGSFLDLMLSLKETEPDFSDDLMVAQFFIFILAGFETTSTALTYALYLLSKNPEVQIKARLEAQNVFKEHGKSMDSLKKLTYLECIINETLRLFPPVTGMFRLAEKPFKLPCGTILPAGSGVSVSLYDLHRDPRFYKDPLNFIPERWEEPQKVFYPFGLGPRLCIGMKFALLEMKIFLSSVILNYNIKLNSATVEPLSFDPTSFMYKTINPILLDFEKNV
nr:cytochrome P450 6j1-like [Halyomorpha halys]XP_024217124.1 cytochrome P450 6j1-like [Halyomorpha halys]XP_024217125.1 cytochrome P450 6j1-like [Halyomorpha halys]XP_024217126.1 cytochrome P450 6j1-like [Halyomorpha halys]XP_024217127.1 cytochrome P450 6j1-like [Halyomorpha halys]